MGFIVDKRCIYLREKEATKSIANIGNLSTVTFTRTQIIHEQFIKIDPFTRVVNLGTTTNCVNAILFPSHIGTCRGSCKAENWINKGKCHFHF